MKTGALQKPGLTLFCLLRSLLLDSSASLYSAFALIALVLATTFSFSSAHAQESVSVAKDNVELRLVADKEAFQPALGGAVGRIGVYVIPKNGWHVYWRNSGESGMPTNINWKLPDSWTAKPLLWPIPEVFEEEGGITTYGYGEPVLLFAKLKDSDNLIFEGDVTIEANVQLLACKEICVPGSATLKRTFLYSSQVAEAPSSDWDIFEKQAERLPRPKVGDLTVTSKLAIEDDLDFSLTLDIETLPEATTARIKDGLENHIQVFPLNLADAESDLPSLTNFNSEEGSATIELRGKLPPGSSGDISFSGLLALSPSLTPYDSTTALSWFSTATVGNVDSLLEEEKRATSSHLPKILKYKLHAPESLFSKSTKDKLNDSSASDISAVKGGADNTPSKSNLEKETSTDGTNKSSGGIFAFLLAIGSAFIAGMILNLMPCVLPIISIKVMTFVQHTDEPRSKVLASAFAYAAGILSSMLALALVVIMLRNLGTQFGWGFQFQHPEFVLALLLIVFVLSLGFFDVFTFRVPFINKANKLASAFEGGFAKNFFDGVLATALSTPCTAPFLGTALAFAFTQPPVFTISVFLSIGLGLALPYVYLATNPRLLSLLPKPGDWMYTFREFMGFLLLVTALWLLFVLHKLVGSGALWCVALLLLVYFNFWFEKHVTKNNPGKITRSFARIAFYIFMAVTIFSVWPKVTTIQSVRETNLVNSSEEIQWIPFQSEYVFPENATGESTAINQTMFIDFTAEWCITCKVNERFVINTPEVISFIRDNDIIAVKADWTSGDDDITAAIKHFGGSGVPLYVVIPKSGGEPIVLSSVITKGSLLDALRAG